MANFSSNVLFTLSVVLFVVGLLFLVYPYLTLTAITLCTIGYTSFNYRVTLEQLYSHFLLKFWPSGNDHQSPYVSNLFSGIDLPSPIPHISSLDAVKYRRSPADEIISSTPRSTPTKHCVEIPASLSTRPTLHGSANDSGPLNFGRVASNALRAQALDFHQNSIDTGSNQKLCSRPGGSRTVQTMAGPLLSSTRFNSGIDAGIFVNVNSPGFTDRLVRCSNDTNGVWSHGSNATRQEKYGSVGLFPIVHLSAPSSLPLSAKNSQKAPNSSVRVRIAPPVYSEFRHHHVRGNNISMKSVGLTRDSARRSDISKSVLESLQEASRKRIYSQCQEAMEEDSGKKRQRKSDSTLPNPNCDMYQYRHIRALPTPSIIATNDFDIHPQNKRLHDDPSSRTNEPKRQCQYVKTKSSNNEISSSLSSSKTLLQRLNGNKRKADSEEGVEDTRGKHFKDSFNRVPSSTHSRWLHAAPCDGGNSAARTQEVLRSSQRKSISDASQSAVKSTLLKKSVPKGSVDKSNVMITPTPPEKKKICATACEKNDSDLSAKLFRKDVASRPHQRTNLSEKKGSSWTQEPPDADERCLSEQTACSTLDRPERFQSLLSRMCGQETTIMKQAEPPCTEPSKDDSVDARVKSNLNQVATFTSSSTVPLPHSAAQSSINLSTFSMAKLGNQNNPSIPGDSTRIFASQSSNHHDILPPSYTASVTQEGPKASSGTQEKTVGGSNSALPVASSGIHTSPTVTKLTLNFSSASSSQSPPEPVVPHTVSTNTPITCSASDVATSAFQTVMAPSEKVDSGAIDNRPLAVVTSMSLPAKTSEASAQDRGFSILATQPQANVAPFSLSAEKSATVPTDTTSKFLMPEQTLQFPINSSSFSSPQQELQLGKQTSNTFTSTSASNLSIVESTASPISFSTSVLNQAQCAEANQGIGDQKNSIGGFQFTGSSKPLFGQTSTNNNNSTGLLFSFSPVSTAVAKSTPNDILSNKTLGIKTTLDSKSAMASGSITFGTVSTTVVSQPTSSTAFTFSQGNSEGSTTTETTKVSPFQLDNFGAGTTNLNPTLTGFPNPSSQGLYNGFGSTSNLAMSSSFGTSPQSSNVPQSQQQSQGLFSFGSTPSQPASSVAFGTTSPAAPSIFRGAPQQQSFGPTTTSGFPSQSPALSFSASSFGSSTSSSILPFGSSQPPNATMFGGQTGSSNSLFGLASSNPSTFGGATLTSSFGLSPPAESAFGSNPSATATISPNSAFTFGNASDKPTAPTSTPTLAPSFNFGGPAPPFNFGSTEQQPQNNSQPFQFGQAASGSAPTFQFGSTSTQPGVFSFGASSPSFGSATHPVPLGSFTIGSGAPAFSMGSGPSTPPRSRASLTRRRRL